MGKEGFDQLVRAVKDLDIEDLRRQAAEAQATRA